MEVKLIEDGKLKLTLFGADEAYIEFVINKFDVEKIKKVLVKEEQKVESIEKNPFLRLHGNTVQALKEMKELWLDAWISIDDELLDQIKKKYFLPNIQTTLYLMEKRGYLEIKRNVKGKIDSFKIRY